MLSTRLTARTQKSYNPAVRDPAILECSTHLINSRSHVDDTSRTRFESAYTLSNVNWVTAGFMVAFHVLAIAAFWFFSWQNLIVALVLHWMAVGFGISLGYHRLHTHRGFKTSKAFEYFLAICGTLTLEGGPIFWVATHRKHHQHSDQDGDPHSPREGGFWAHMGWILFGDTHHNNTELMGKYAPDLGRDQFYRWLNTYHWVPLTTLGLILLAVGGWSMVLWGIFLRVVVGLHGTWLVNSATHMWGTRRFETRDDSRNSWWVALLTFGEGWHNNHHAHPVSARHGLAWYEFDISWITLKLFNAVRPGQRSQGREGARAAARRRSSVASSFQLPASSFRLPASAVVLTNHRLLFCLVLSRLAPRASPRASRLAHRIMNGPWSC